MRKFLALALSLLVFSAEAHAFWSSDRELLKIFGELDLSGPTTRNVGALEEYVRARPGANGVDEALLRLGAIYSDRKDYQRAAACYAMVLEDFPDSEFRSQAAYELGVIRYRSGRLKEAVFLIEPLASDPGASFAMRARAGRLLKEIESASYGLAPAENLPAIGVLLPMKGDYAAFGDEALNGVLLAAGVFGSLPPRFEVVVRDTGKNPLSAEAAVMELASESRVKGIVGPLLSSSAMEAASSAQRNRVPIITLSQRDGVTSPGEFVFRNFLTPEDQARALAGYAAASGKKRFAVLYPQTNYGTELLKHFEVAVRERGGSVVRKAAYAPGTADFSSEVKMLFGVQAKERMEGRRKVREFSPTVQVDALFIPDSHEAVALALPYLDYYGITGVQLLGSNGWNSPRLPELAGRAVEGAVFVDGFFTGSVRPGTADFARRYAEAYGREPGVLAAKAYDAALMLMEASVRSLDREGTASVLRETKDFAGATGAISFNSRREAQKGLFFLTVENGRITEAVK